MERRQAAENSLEELRGEVTIGMEDLQPLGLPSEREGEQRNLGGRILITFSDSVHTSSKAGRGNLEQTLSLAP